MIKKLLTIFFLLCLPAYAQVVQLEGNSLPYLNQQLRETLRRVDSVETITDEYTVNDWSGILTLDKGGTGSELVDPDADRIGFWDDSEGEFTWLTIGDNLTITGTTIDATSEHHSNVIFSWNGSVVGTDNIFGLYTGTNFSPGMNVFTNNYTFWGVYQTTYRTIMTSQYVHEAGFSSVKIHALLWSADAGATYEAYLKTTIGSATAVETKSVTVNLPSTWFESATDIDVSGLTVGDTYEIKFELKSEAALMNAYCGGIILTVS